MTCRKRSAYLHEVPAPRGVAAHALTLERARSILALVMDLGGYGGGHVGPCESPEDGDAARLWQEVPHRLQGNHVDKSGHLAALGRFAHSLCC